MKASLLTRLEKISTRETPIEVWFHLDGDNEPPEDYTGKIITFKVIEEGDPNYYGQTQEIEYEKGKSRELH